MLNIILVRRTQWNQESLTNYNRETERRIHQQITIQKLKGASTNKLQSRNWKAYTPIFDFVTKKKERLLFSHFLYQKNAEAKTIRTENVNIPHACCCQSTACKIPITKWVIFTKLKTKQNAELFLCINKSLILKRLPNRIDQTGIGNPFLAMLSNISLRAWQSPTICKINVTN